MSLLDNDLVDQIPIDEQFREMIYELYERFINGTLSVDEIEKNLLPEREIGGLKWRVVYYDVNCYNGCPIFSYGYNAVIGAGGCLLGATDRGIEDEEKLPLLNREYAKDLINKLIDLYWDKRLYDMYWFEVKNIKGDDKWRFAGSCISLGDILSWKILDIKKEFHRVVYHLNGELDPQGCKVIKDWIESDGRFRYDDDGLF